MAMANPRRAISLQIHSQAPPAMAASAAQPSVEWLLRFLRRPASLPFLLSVFLLLTWLCLRFHHAPLRPSTSAAARDAAANLVRYPAAGRQSPISADARGWMLDPVAATRRAGLRGGAVACLSLHVGQIHPGGTRGNHRHHTCNETFVIWGAKTKFRLENADVEDKGYAEALVAAGEVAVAASATSTAHALINFDVRPTFFLGCQDAPTSPNSSNTDYKVWRDLLTQ